MTHVRTIAMMSLITLALPFAAIAQVDTGEASSTVSFSSAYAFQRQGVFGCNLNGSYAMSVGALSATGGVYVPVNDAAVTLNTGYLVYKECVLRGIVDRMRESSSSALQKMIINAYERGRAGQPLFSQNLALERRNTTDQVYVRTLQGGALSTLNPTLQGPVTRGVAQGYMIARNASNRSFSCTYANMPSLMKGNPSGSMWSGLAAIGTPGCDPIVAYNRSSESIAAQAAAAVNDMMTQLQWGEGTYPVMGIDANGNPVVLTPASIVQSNTLQALQTGFRQLENANDIDQMVGALFAGITSQVVSDNRGLAGLIQPTGGQPSYLDQVARESAQGVRDSAVNAAIQILTASRQVEAGYKAAMEAIAKMLTTTIGNIRGKENTCWNLVIQNVCANGAVKADGTCIEALPACDPTEGQCPTGGTLKVATSTAFSQQVISASIAPIASTTATNINASATALSKIDQLIQGVTNTVSLDAQRVALQQLDALVSQRALHTQYDMQGAQEQQKTLASTMAQLITDTATAWGDSTDISVGWCNVSSTNPNKEALLDAWKTCWRQGSTTCIFPH